VKQADVLMLHHLVPDDVMPGSLAPNLEFYEPRTAHGSSLSPAVHASLLARVGRLGRALQLLRTAAMIDLEDLTGTTAGGVHLATMGGVWQALAFGVAGLRPRGDRLVIDPRLPEAWDGLELRIRFRGAHGRIRIRHDGVTVDGDPELQWEEAT
jgi:trehalose/maltose hydrolase-like predicted phosphorylase